MKKSFLVLSCLLSCNTILCSCNKEEESPKINIDNYTKYTETLYFTIDGYSVTEIRTKDHYLFCDDVYFIATLEKYNGTKENVYLLPSDTKYNYNGMSCPHDFSIRTSLNDIKKSYLIEAGGTLVKMK